MATTNMEIYFPVRRNVDMSKLMISEVGKYSISKPGDAALINKIVKRYFPKNTAKNVIITDATANNGGDTIHFAFDFKQVNSVEIDAEQFAILSNNVEVYGLDNVVLYNNDYLTIMNTLEQDVIFIDAPWGGPNYYTQTNLDLFLGKRKLVNIVRELYNNNKFKLCVLKVPKNFNFQDLFDKIPIIKMDFYNLRKFIIICITISP